MTPIADMVRQMLEKGVAAEAIVIAVQGAELAMSANMSTRQTRTTVDEAAERRRAWDRDRKRLQRGTRLPESEWLPLVALVMERDGYKCTYCGSAEKLTADHVVPLTRGGSNDPSNLTACCISCNTKKSNKLVTEWLPGASTVFHPSVHPNPPDDKNASLSKEEKKEVIQKEREVRVRMSGGQRGQRLPEAWCPQNRDWAEAQHILGRRADDELLKFRDHWKAQPGQKGVKTDWDATWRNWARRAKEYGNGKATTDNPRQGSLIAALDRRIAASQIEEEFD